MKVEELSKISAKRFEKILCRSKENYEDVMYKVDLIIKQVQSKGDKALKDYSRMFDKVEITDFKVSAEEIQQAYSKVDVKTISALQQAAKNILTVHESQLRNRVDVITEPEKGIKVWREWRAIERVGMYVPGGRAAYPSTVLMTSIPAKVAGCREIVITTPPNREGSVSPVILVAADVAGVSEIYKVGGAQAIAALAYGTESIPKVSKIFGPGNTFVTAAKVLVSRDTAIDMPAGPSEVFVIADESANPAFIAADLLADGEHGEDSACVLVTTSEKIAKETLAEINKQLKKLPTAERVKKSLENYGVIAVVKNIEEAVVFANNYAPEHLELMTKNNAEIIKNIRNAGSIFSGEYTAKASGDYATGANHVLPTGGMAKVYPPLGVDAFGKWMQVQESTKEGLQTIRQTLEVLAEVEGLPAHKNCVSIRF